MIRKEVAQELLTISKVLQMLMAPFVTSSKRAALRWWACNLQSVGIRDILVVSVKEKNQGLILSEEQ